jgi:NADPH2:quinone reductase
MAREILINRFGGPEVLELHAVADRAPGPGEVRIRQTAIGVNFTDIHGRRGDYAPLHGLPMPLVLGMEAAGVVEALGEGVERFRVGDRVAYASVPLGAYREVRNFPAARCVPLPAGVSDRDAAAVLLKGLTVHMLVRRVFRVTPGTWVVFHSAAGGVGSLAGRWLRTVGARAIGIVGAQSKVAAALASGYEKVFVRGRDDWPARVRELSGGGVPAVYDAVGRETWQGSLACLAPRGHLVCFGNSSGLVPPFSVNELRDRGSLSVSWVRFSDYTASPAELQAAAQELFAALAGRALAAPAPRCLPLEHAAEAHRLLESGETTGPLVLVPSSPA